MGKLFKLLNVVDAGRTINQDLPLAYCLMLDPATPMGPKAMFGAKMVFVVIDAPVPILGEVDAIVAIRAFKTFIGACEKADPDLVQRHRRDMLTQTSTWHRHTASGVDTARAFTEAIVEHAQPVKESIKRVSAPSRDVVRKASKPARDALKRFTGRGRDLG